MSLFIRQENEARSELQQRIAAELRAKAAEKAKVEGNPKTGLEDINDSAYMQGTKKTTSLAWLWALIALAVVVTLIWLVVATR